MGRRLSKLKEIGPTLFVFCEGETEANFIKYLRSKYRISIEIISKIEEPRLTNTTIKKFKDGKEHPKDKTFLMYDLDVSGTMEHLLKLKNTILLGSNPCIELWFLIHFQEVKSQISSSECIKKLLEHVKNYKKGQLSEKLKNKLEENQNKAIKRAKNYN